MTRTEAALYWEARSAAEARKAMIALHWGEDANGPRHRARLYQQAADQIRAEIERVGE